MCTVWCNSSGQTRFKRVLTSDSTVLQLWGQDLIAYVSLSGFRERFDSLQKNGSNLSSSQYIHENSHSMGPINDDLDVLPAP
jgi:hypothetical protein